MILTKPDKDLTYRVLKTVADADAHEGVCWFVEKDNKIVFYVDVSTDFGRPLLVRVHEDNVFLLEDALLRVRRLTHNSDQWRYTLLLFACRAVCERPPAAAYPQDFQSLWPWLDICGETRRLICNDEPLEA